MRLSKEISPNAEIPRFMFNKPIYIKKIAHIFNYQLQK